MKPLRWLPVVLLAGCTPAPPPAVTQACDVHKAAEIPITFVRGGISAPAVIEDKPVTVMIDTGSEISLVTPSAVTLLRLQPDLHRRTTIQGTGGAVTTQNVAMQSFGIGGMEMLDQSAAVGPLPDLRGGAATNASGLLGADWLKDFDIELDLPHGRIALYRVHGCSGDYVPWPGEKDTIFAQIYRRGLVIVSVKLDNQPVTAILDSGAGNSVLKASVATRIGVDAVALVADPAGKSMGVDGATIRTHRHRFGRLQVGDVSYPGPLVVISPLNLPMADMLLGADWLRGNRVWISYAARRMTFQPTAPGG